jgi:uncharacterized protein involved in tolerance to divalent cations
MKVGIGLCCAKAIGHRIASLVLTERLDSCTRIFPSASEMFEVGQRRYFGSVCTEYAVHKLLASVTLLQCANKVASVVAQPKGTSH